MVDVIITLFVLLNRNSILFSDPELQELISLSNIKYFEDFLLDIFIPAFALTSPTWYLKIMSRRRNIEIEASLCAISD